MGHFLWRINAREDLGGFSIEKIRCGGGLWTVSMANMVGFIVAVIITRATVKGSVPWTRGSSSLPIMYAPTHNHTHAHTCSLPHAPYTHSPSRSSPGAAASSSQLQSALWAPHLFLTFAGMTFLSSGTLHKGWVWNQNCKE